MTTPQTVETFFSDLCQHYDAAILRAIPPYREIFSTLLGTLPFSNDAPLRILDLGCGTGNLSTLLALHFPNAQFTLVDLSGDMVESAAAKIRAASPNTKVTPQQGDFTQVQFPDNTFDLIVTSFAFHHVATPKALLRIYENLLSWLVPGGVFRCADGCLGQPGNIKVHNKKGWLDWAKNQGATEEELTAWLDHEVKYDHFFPLVDHLQWLQQAGLSSVDCYWKKFHWSIYGGSRTDV